MPYLDAFSNLWGAAPWTPRLLVVVHVAGAPASARQPVPSTPTTEQGPAVGVVKTLERGARVSPVLG